jgi:hypothetical protein
LKSLRAAFSRKDSKLRGKNGNSYELAFAFVHGRIDRELEVWAERFSIPSVEFKQELGTILVSAQGNHLPSAGMHQTATGAKRQAVATLEMAVGTHGGDAQRGGNERTANSEVQRLAAGEVNDKRTGPKNWYNSLSEKEKLEVTLQRLKKRKDKVGKQMYKSVLAKSQGKTFKGKLAKTRPKQAIYAARSAARKAGLPLPPLPSETASNAA